MSVAKLKEEGNKALHKKDYRAALEFYDMVCYCTIRAPEVFLFPYYHCLIVSIAMAYITIPCFDGMCFISLCSYFPIHFNVVFFM